MRIVCVSDTHGFHKYTEVPDGDVLIHGGDLTKHGSLEDVEQYRLGASTLRSCFGDKNPPKFLTSSRCTQCHLGRDNGVGAALDLTSPDLGKRLSTLIGSCPEELIIDPAAPEAVEA